MQRLLSGLSGDAQGKVTTAGSLSLPTAAEAAIPKALISVFVFYYNRLDQTSETSQLF